MGGKILQLGIGGNYDNLRPAGQSKFLREQYLMNFTAGVKSELGQRRVAREWMPKNVREFSS